MPVNEILFLDLEVDNRPYYGAMASPRHPENFVVMNGFAIESEPYKGEIQYDHYRTKAEVPSQWLNIPDDVWLIVMHNAPFEMDWFFTQQRKQIMAFLKRGGRIWDTAYAEYLLSHQLNTYPSLDETAPTYGGSHKVDGIKILWEQGVLTSAIDSALLAKYLTSNVKGEEGDVANTRLIFYGQYAKMVEQRMLGMFFDRMEGLLFNTFAMDSGLYVDREVAFRQRDEGEAKLAELAAGFQQYRSHIPEYVKFNPGSDFHMSAWLFGGPIKYVGRELATTEKRDEVTLEVKLVQKWVKADFVKEASTGNLLRLDEAGKWNGVTPEVYDFDIPLEKYKSGKNKGMIKVFREDTDEPMMRNADMMFTVAPLVDLSLLPQNLYKEFKKEFTGNRVLADESPVFSTGKDALDMLSLRKEFPEHIIKVLTDLQEWAKIDKDMGTYYLREEKDDAGNVVKQSGMLQYLTSENYVHHMLNATATVTTRLSSNRPNLQNIPQGGTSDVKKMFTSRFGAHGFILEADYSALEVVTLAAFSKDEALTEALMSGIDMHCMRLSAQLNEPYDEVKVKCKDENHPDYARYSQMRTDIKPKAFSYQYGATAYGIAFSTGCTVEEAQLFIDTEKALFPGVESWFSDTVFPEIAANAETHREQSDDGRWMIYQRGVWTSPSGTRYSFRQYPKKEWYNGQSVETMQYKPTQMRNYPIQGESGFFVQGTAGRVVRWLIQNDFFPDPVTGKQRVYIINQVHDALYFDVHMDVLDAVAEGVKSLMEDLPNYFNKTHGYDLQVPFPAAVEFGRSMHEKIHWHKGVLQDEKVREKLGWPPANQDNPLPLAA